MTRKFHIRETTASDSLKPASSHEDPIQMKQTGGDMTNNSSKAVEFSSQSNISTDRSDMQDAGGGRQGRSDETSKINPGLALRDWTIQQLGKPHSEPEKTGMDNGSRGYETFADMKARARSEIEKRVFGATRDLEGRGEAGRDTSFSDPNDGKRLSGGGLGTQRNSY